MSEVVVVHFVKEAPETDDPMEVATYVCMHDDCEMVVFDYDLPNHADTHNAVLITRDNHSWKAEAGDGERSPEEGERSS